jgi:hypothetical protein
LVKPPFARELADANQEYMEGDAADADDREALVGVAIARSIGGERSMSRPFLRRPSLYCSLALLASCTDALAPEDVVGIYTLTHIQGQSPPVVVHDEPSCRTTVVDGSLTLTPDSRFELRLDETAACPEPAPQAQVWLGSYEVEGDAVVLRAVAPGVASDAAADLRLRPRNGVLVVPLGGSFGDVAFARPRGTGRLVLHTRTDGAELDPDGYGVRLDANAPLAIGINDSLVLPDVPAGRHEVAIEGVASNCSLDAITSPITVRADASFDVNVEIACVARTGYLAVRTSTTGGDPDGDEFTVQVDTVRRSVPRNGAVALLVPPGEHQVLLDALRGCTVEGANPQTVTIAADDAVRVTFVVTCADQN